MIYLDLKIDFDIFKHMILIETFKQVFGGARCFKGVRFCGNKRDFVHFWKVGMYCQGVDHAWIRTGRIMY